MEVQVRENQINEVARRSLVLAREYAQENAWGRSVAHYFVVLEVCPELKTNLANEFSNSMTQWATQLILERKHREFFLCCEQTLSVFPRNCRILYELGRHLITLGSYMQACGFLQKALIADASFAPANTYLNVAKNSLVNRWHYRMLNDRRRNLTYKRAIHDSISAQDFVLDIGCGSGLLSLYASETKAGIVACEDNEAMVTIATEVFTKNNVNVLLLPKKSMSINLEETGGLKFSAVVTEIFDAGLFGEGALQTLIHAWENLLISRPRGKVLPQSAALYLCGVESETLARKYRFIHTKKNSLFNHINFENINIFDDHKEPYDTQDLSLIKDLKYVTDVHEILRVDFQNVDEMKSILENIIEKDIKFEIIEKCKIDAYIMWFDLSLTDNISLTTDPRNARRCTAWDTAIFYRTFPLTCNKNESTMINVKFQKGIINVTYDSDANRFDFPVPKNVVRILNDSDYIDKMVCAVSFACIHLVQLFTFENIKVLDTTSFPIIGLLLLIRGVRILGCTYSGKHLIRKLSEQNKFSMKNVRFLNIYSYDTSRYEIIVNDFIDLSGMIIFKELITSEILKTHKLRDGGILMPSNIRMVGRIISSQYLNNFNRVYDVNLTENEEYQWPTKNIFKTETLRNSNCAAKEGSSREIKKFSPIICKPSKEKKSEDEVPGSVWKYASADYKIANAMNVYQVSYNTHHSSVSFEKSYLSNEFEIFDTCAPDCEHITVDIVATEDGQIDAIQIYYKIELICDTEELSTDRDNSFTNNSYFLIDPPMAVTKGEKLTVLVFCNTLEHFRMLVDRYIGE